MSNLPDHPKHYTVKMTLKYLIVLGVLAVLAFANYYSMKYALKGARFDAARVDISTRQSMLFERSAFLAPQLVEASHPALRTNVREKLIDAIQGMERYHDALLKGDPQLGLPGNPPPEVRAIYFEPPMLLDNRVRNYLRELKTLAYTRDEELNPADVRLRSIRNVASGKVLEGLAAVVEVYQSQSEAKVSRARRFQRWLLRATLFILVLLGLFIFRPMVRQVRRDMEALEKANEQLENLAELDPMTGLLNRRGLKRALSHEIGRSDRKGEQVLILIVDVDDFKSINDAWGYAVGDIVLKEIANKLKSRLRATDYIARIGGDEFMILLPNTRSAEGMQIAQKIRLSVSGKVISLATGESPFITVSMGVGIASKENPSIDALISQIYPALVNSKRNGKNRVSFDVEAREAEGDPSPVSALERLRNGNIYAVKHAIFHLADRSIVGYEFLSRAKIESLEMPDVFFRVALENNILARVDHQCFKTCVAATEKISADIRCHLNLFPSTLIDLSSKNVLESIPNQRWNRYCIELSEQQIIGDPSHLIQFVKILKQAGVLIAIDDVGFGYSCLESLILLEPDVIKIDKKCVHSIAEDPARVRSLRRLLNVVSTLDAEVIAEGIETERELELVQDLGVRYGQGFLFGKPD